MNLCLLGVLTNWSSYIIDILSMEVFQYADNMVSYYVQYNYVESRILKSAVFMSLSPCAVDSWSPSDCLHQLSPLFPFYRHIS